MAYETGAASGMEDLLGKLSTFAQADGWTQDVFDIVTNKHLALSKSTVHVQFKYDTTTGHIAIYQSTAYSGAAPGSQTNDSGSGDYSGAVNVGRRITSIGNLAYPAYYFFSGNNYIHVALEFQPGIYRHFCFGELVKIGTWTGGAYCGGHVLSVGSEHDIWATTNAFLLDGMTNTGTLDFQSTIHMEGMPDQAVGGKWGAFGSHTQGNAGIDKAGVARMPVLGGIRGGLLEAAYGWFAANPANGFIPMLPIACYLRKTTVNPEIWRLLGYMPDTRMVNITFINPGEEVTLGADVWKFFPWIRKGDSPAPAGQDWSGHMGIAYLKS